MTSAQAVSSTPIEGTVKVERTNKLGIALLNAKEGMEKKQSVPAPSTSGRKRNKRKLADGMRSLVEDADVEFWDEVFKD